MQRAPAERKLVPLVRVVDVLLDEVRGRLRGGVLEGAHVTHDRRSHLCLRVLSHDLGDRGGGEVLLQSEHVDELRHALGDAEQRRVVLGGRLHESVPRRRVHKAIIPISEEGNRRWRRGEQEAVTLDDRVQAEALDLEARLVQRLARLALRQRARRALGPSQGLLGSREPCGSVRGGPRRHGGRRRHLGSVRAHGLRGAARGTRG